ncbi:MAG: TetR/AcrR family transcriptional regulator [Candidatus Marinimicrobia bacterium]|nr:TetR/AcrR family transcriptional regulator [Candidatus Neomarinimicrobiota bacterium]
MGKNAKEILKKATWDLVLKKGFKATKVQDICELAGVSKMTFYYYYDNKHEIIEEVLKEFFNDTIKSSEAIINQNIPFHDRIMNLVHWKAEFIKTMSPKFVQELYTSGGQYMELMKELMQKAQKLTYEFYQYGKDSGEINKSVDIPILMFWMNIISDMIIEGKFNHLFDDPKEMNKQIRDLMLYGVLGNSK